MGKRAKGLRADKRKKEKRAAKERKAAMYKSYSAAGKNKGSKRSTLKNRRGKVSFQKHTHPDGACGNLACRKCFPYNKPIFNFTKPTFLGFVNPKTGLLPRSGPKKYKIPKHIREAMKVVALRRGGKSQTPITDALLLKDGEHATSPQPR